MCVRHDVPAAPAYTPTCDSPQTQSPPPLSPTTNITSAYNNSPKLFSSTLPVTPCMYVQVVQNLSIVSPMFLPVTSPRTSQLPLNSIPPPAWPLLVAIAQSCLAPPPQTAQSKTNGHHPLPSRNDPHMVRRWPNVHNYVNLVLMNGSYEVRNRVGIPPPDNSTE